MRRQAMTATNDGADELESRLRRGDAEALGKLFALHRARLWRTVNFRLSGRLAGRVDPDDVLQESYLVAAERIDHFRQDWSASAFLWLRTVVLQVLVDLHRRHLGTQKRDAGKELSLFGHYPQATSASMAIHLVGDWTSPSQAAIRGESLDIVERAIAGMEPIDQEILALRHFEELSNSEVAEVLSIQPKAASIRYIRALGRLKEILSAVPGLLQGLDGTFSSADGQQNG
jgi:RNA polymerase sigma-70 factor, ECF subfamily